MELETYTLKKKRNTEELHLFKTIYDEGGNDSDEKSICGNMNRCDSSEEIFTCEYIDLTRVRCAVNGRKVCGDCVSKLYASY